MQFPSGNLLQAALCASSVSALAVPLKPRAPTDLTSVSFSGYLADGQLVEASDDSELSVDVEERQIITVAITVASFVGSAVATAIITAAAEDGYEFAKGLVSSLKQWTPAREAFTKRTTAGMWARNPNRAKYPAAICYNKDYKLAKPDGFLARNSIKFSVGKLHTTYDCLYMSGGNTFETKDDGGFINLSYSFDTARCGMDHTNGDLTCR